MKVTIEDFVYGKIEYEESTWIGKRSIKIGGVQLLPQGKNVFLYDNGERTLEVRVQGNFATGLKLVIEGNEILLTKKAKWYEIVLSALIFVFVLAWGNSTYLCSIFVMVGGAIGGAISGAVAISCLAIMKKAKSIATKLLVWLGMFALAVLLCSLTGQLILLAIL